MRISVVVPEWAGEQTLYILSCIELVAYKEVGKYWQVKTVDGHCSYCGTCCVIGGVPCEFLMNHSLGKQCSLGLARHLDCCVLVPSNFVCTQRLNEQQSATGAPNISVEVPDWAGQMAMYILSGLELAAYKKVEFPWMVKTRRCVACAICCRLQKCNKLTKGPGSALWCAEGMDRPFHCCVAAPVDCDSGCKQVFEEQVTAKP